jgi:hypothetical protein
MSKIKPYIFWIICGTVLLIELVCFVVISPSANGKSPTEIKKALDDQKKELDKLRDKANNGFPGDQRIFDPNKPTDIADLKSKWLTTLAWQPGLTKLLNDYQSQMDDVLEYLKKRSQPLHRAISTEEDGFHWYEAYAKATGDLLEEMYHKKCLNIPPKNANPNPAGGPPNASQPPLSVQDQIANQANANGGGHPDASAPAASSDDSQPNFQTDSSLREVAKFITTSNYPKPEEYEQLTTRFRIMEMVGKVLLRTTATNLTSPMLKQRPPLESPAKLFSTAWGSDNSDDVISLKITLYGPLSALLAAEAALEENKDGNDEPVRIVTGASLDHKEYAKGERIGIPAELVYLHLDLAILDFTALTKNPISVMPVPPKVVAPKATPAAPRPVTQDSGDAPAPSARSSMKDDQ